MDRDSAQSAGKRACNIIDLIDAFYDVKDGITKLDYFNLSPRDEAQMLLKEQLIVTRAHLEKLDNIIKKFQG